MATKITIEQVRELTENYDKTLGICALVDIENMGFCKDGVTRYYQFELYGNDYIYFKH